MSEMTNDVNYGRSRKFTNKNHQGVAHCSLGVTSLGEEGEIGDQLFGEILKILATDTR